MSELNRLRWKCRRGMLELDLVLSRFLEQRYPLLDAADRQVFAALLQEADETLWAMISATAGGAADAVHPVLSQLRACSV